MRLPFRRSGAPTPDRERVGRLYEALVTQARAPVFYAACRVPDTLEGRFEMVALHVVLLLRRLDAAPEPEARPLGQAVFDRMVQDLDRSLRDAGVGDLSVGKQVKRLGEHFYGLIATYGTALDGDDDSALRQALDRNLWGEVEPTAAATSALTAYTRAAAAALTAIGFPPIAEGRPGFPEPAAAMTPPQAGFAA